jgi:hypothetical protein
MTGLMRYRVASAARIMFPVSAMNGDLEQGYCKDHSGTCSTGDVESEMICKQPSSHGANNACEPHDCLVDCDVTGTLDGMAQGMEDEVEEESPGIDPEQCGGTIERERGRTESKQQRRADANQAEDTYRRGAIHP